MTAPGEVMERPKSGGVKRTVSFIEAEKQLKELTAKSGTDKTRYKFKQKFQ